MSHPHTWFVLLHTPGPLIGSGESVFDSPGIQEHYAFLRRRVEAGQLVAAGPMQDVLGEGMSVLDVESLDEAERLATQDDQAVVAGVLEVRVRPWTVVMSRD